MNGLGYRDFEHFESRAYRMGLGTKRAVGDLWEVTRDGETISPLLHVDEVHGWLDELEASQASEG